MAPAQTKRIQFTPRTPVAIHEGLILAPGTYPGTVTRIGVPAYVGDLSWKAPHYKIELTGAQLTAMGQQGGGLMSPVKFDVTHLVRTHKITPLEFD